MDLNARHVALAVVAVLGACSTGDDDTLTPLPIEGGTVAGPTTTTVPGAPVSTAPGAVPLPTVSSTVPAVSSVPPVSTVPPASTVPGAPTGDWDGARFDVGVIESVSALGAYSAIELDRWSYTRPDGSTVDAGGLDAEPVVAWWRTSPFSNVRMQTRTFVLAPDVEVLTLDPQGRAAACADPPPANPPTPEWESSGTSALGSVMPGDIAVLTYSDVGLVTRLRFTRGC